VLFELDLEAVQARPVPVAQPLPRHQSSVRDLALVLPEGVAAQALLDALRADASGLVRDVLLFDVYKPQAANGDMATGERSLAVRLELLDPAATLTEDRIDATVQAAIERARAVGARLRA
jgi:phenylalanyl-tRNA synthetase beta chain